MSNAISVLLSPSWGHKGSIWLWHLCSCPPLKKKGNRIHITTQRVVLLSKCNVLAILRGSNDLTDGINEYKICVKSSAFTHVSSRTGMVISVPSWDLNLFVWYSLPWRWRGGLKSSTYSLWERSVIRQTQGVLSDSPHILHSGYDLLPSGRCWRVPHCRLNSFKNSSVPTSIKIEIICFSRFCRLVLCPFFVLLLYISCMWVMCFRCDLFIYMHFVYTW